jgi:hypothetical protein
MFTVLTMLCLKHYDRDARCRISSRLDSTEMPIAVISGTHVHEIRETQAYDPTLMRPAELSAIFVYRSTLSEMQLGGLTSDG